VTARARPTAAPAGRPGGTRHRDIDPRITERRVGVARQAGRSRLKGLIAAVVVVALAAGLFAMAHSPLVSARHVTVSGAEHTTAAEILAAGGLGGDPPLIDVNTLADAHAIERLPWVKTASVSVSFPSSARVVVTERHAEAVVRRDSGGDALLDVTGRVLADVPGHVAGLVSIEGLAPPPAPGGKERGAAALLATAAALPASLVARVAALRAEPGLGVVAVLRGAPRVILGSDSELTEKMVALATVLSEVSLQGIATIDLRAPSDPVLTP
jgi:cell division protein FtsQ